MTTKKQTKTESVPPAASPAGYDPAAALHEVARALPAAVPLTKAEIGDLRSVERRAPPKLIALVLAEAENGGGVIAGVRIDATSRSDVAQAAKLRVAAATARSIARRLEQQALVLASGVAQRALSATTSLEAYARTPEGRSLAAKASELRVAARAAKRSRAKATTTNAPTQPAAATEAPAAGTPVTTGAAHAAT